MGFFGGILGSVLGGGGGSSGIQQGEWDWMNSGLYRGVSDSLDLFGQGKSMYDMKQAQEEANKANLERYMQQLGINAESLAAAQRRGDTTEKILSGNIGDVQAGWDAAINKASGIGGVARQGIQDQGVQNLAGTQQSLVSRGLGNSTVLDSANRGVRSDTQRSMNDLDERMAALQAGLIGSKTGAVSNATTNLANFQQGRNQFETGILGDRTQIIGDRTDQANMPLLLSLLGRSQQPQGGGSSGGGGSIFDLAGKVLPWLF